MKNTIILVLLCPFFLYAAENTLETKTNDSSVFNSRKNHWVVNVGSEGLAYTLPFSYDGIEKDFEEENRTLIGARVGVGKEFYLGGGFLFGIRGDGYYAGTLFTKEKTAGDPYPDESYKTTKDTGSLYGVDGVLHLGWMFDYKTKNPFLNETVNMAMELFVEGSLGVAQAWNKKRYDYTTTTDEGYRETFADNLTSNAFGGGVNFLSTTSGFFLTLKAMTVNYDVTERKSRRTVIVGGVVDDAQSSVTTSKNVKMDPIAVYTLGAGYKF